MKIYNTNGNILEVSKEDFWNNWRKRGWMSEEEYKIRYPEEFQ